MLLPSHECSPRDGHRRGSCRVPVFHAIGAGAAEPEQGQRQLEPAFRPDARASRISPVVPPFARPRQRTAHHSGTAGSVVYLLTRHTRRTEHLQYTGRVRIRESHDTTAGANAAVQFLRRKTIVSALDYNEVGEVRGQ